MKSEGLRSIICSFKKRKTSLVFHLIDIEMEVSTEYIGYDSPALDSTSKALILALRSVAENGKSSRRCFGVLILHFSDASASPIRILASSGTNALKRSELDRTHNLSSHFARGIFVATPGDALSAYTSHVPLRKVERVDGGKKNENGASALAVKVVGTRKALVVGGDDLDSFMNRKRDPKYGEILEAIKEDCLSDNDGESEEEKDLKWKRYANCLFLNLREIGKDANAFSIIPKISKAYRKKATKRLEAAIQALSPPPRHRCCLGRLVDSIVACRDAGFSLETYLDLMYYNRELIETLRSIEDQDAQVTPLHGCRCQSRSCLSSAVSRYKQSARGSSGTLVGIYSTLLKLCVLSEEGLDTSIFRWLHQCAENNALAKLIRLLDAKEIRGRIDKVTWTSAHTPKGFTLLEDFSMCVVCDQVFLEDVKSVVDAHNSVAA
jgi:hypothetical protein